MHHLIILLPLLGIVVFLLLPLSQAIPVYLVILLASGLMYWAVVLAMRNRPKTGVVGMIGRNAEVVSRLGPKEDAQYLVRAEGELWRANSEDPLAPGDTVSIVGVNGLTLVVKKITNEPSSP